MWTNIRLSEVLFEVHRSDVSYSEDRHWIDVCNVSKYEPLAMHRVPILLSLVNVVVSDRNVCNGDVITVR